MKRLVTMLIIATLLTASPAYASEERIADLEEKVEALESRVSDMEDILRLFLSDSGVFDEDEDDNTEEPVFYLYNASGSTENGDEIVIYRDEDMDEESLSLDVWNYNGTLLTYIYADDELVEKSQLKDNSFSIYLSGAAIEPGTHTVELRQYEDNDTDTEPIFVQSAEYTVK